MEKNGHCPQIHQSLPPTKWLWKDLLSPDGCKECSLLPWSAFSLQKYLSKVQGNLQLCKKLMFNCNPYLLLTCPYFPCECDDSHLPLSEGDTIILPHPVMMPWQHIYNTSAVAHIVNTVDIHVHVQHGRKLGQGLLNWQYGELFRGQFNTACK